MIEFIINFFFLLGVILTICWVVHIDIRISKLEKTLNKKQEHIFKEVTNKDE